MISPRIDSWRPAWRSFVQEMVTEADREFKSASSRYSWIKQDGSRVSGLDLRLDAAVRIALARHFPALAVLSEETGLLSPAGHLDSARAIVDPVDGTDSLLGHRPTWWMSVGIIDGSAPVAGLIYQPATRRIHDSTVQRKERCPRFVVGVSPDHLSSSRAADLRAHLVSEGAELAGTPHSVEKVASVIEGRCAATVYLPSKKSPRWHTWDLAACLAIASANGLLLRTLDGLPVRIGAEPPERSDPWICAHDEATWNLVCRGMK